MTQLGDRAAGALLGLAIGDSLGLPADMHRSVREPWPRGAVWRANAALDAERVARPLLPFAADLEGTRGIVPTDDSETAAVAALALLSGDDPDGWFAVWLEHHAREDAWMGVAARSAVVNAKLGLRPPQTGSDNPASWGDDALPAAIPIGIAIADADRAGQTAARYATITNAGEGVDAARVLAIAISRLVAGQPLAVALDNAVAAVPDGGWLADGFEAAAEIVGAAEVSAAAGFAALPALIERLSPRDYSHAGIAAHTLPLAFALARIAHGSAAVAIPLALAIARTADSLPPLCGALCGALGDRSTLDPAWAGLDELHGVLLPGTRGVRLRDLAERLLVLRTSSGAGNGAG
jgi:ADP-ribosylglycohydrolase